MVSPAPLARSDFHTRCSRSLRFVLNQGMQMASHKLRYIDALRGYAIMLVIGSHAFPMVHGLPWTIKRFSNLGFFGVQLFFVVSCVTLTRSWRSGKQTFPDMRGFLVRRVFRIAPAYYLASICYLMLWHHALPSFTRVLTFVTFTNGWSPSQMPTIQKAWIGVPGGWSIEAEFAFYALFPVIMVLGTGVKRASIMLLASLPLAWIADVVAASIYGPIYGATSTDQFLYYWLPNELPVFLCGLVLHEVMVQLSPGGAWQEAGDRIARRAAWLLTGSVLAFASLGLMSWPRLATPGFAFVSSPTVAALAFCGCTVALAVRPTPLVVNALIIRLGQASFSAYLLHFAVIAALERVVPASVFATTGLVAIASAFLFFLAILLVTGAFSQATYRLIELPAIRLGQRFNAGLDRSRAFVAPMQGGVVGRNPISK